MNDIDDSTWSGSFKVLQERTSMSAVSVRGVDAFGRKVVQLLEISIPDIQ
jgi:hypothetical protein